MPDHSQKLFISAHEFLQSWDKELYQLTKLDYFIFLLINYLGNQLDKQYFASKNKLSKLYLDFEDLGTLCFELGDTFEFFLKGNCLNDCQINCLNDLDGYFDAGNNKIKSNIKHKLYILQTFLEGNLGKEQILRIDLMNFVIFDTLIQFYENEFQIELEEDNLDLIELAEFIEDTFIQFIQSEQNNLLTRPFDTSIEIFEELLQKEIDYKNQDEWHNDSTQNNPENENEDWIVKSLPIEEVFVKLNIEENALPLELNGSFFHDLQYLEAYLTEEAELKYLEDLTENHLGYFLSIWLVNELANGNSDQLNNIFQATARFITFIFQNYNINLKSEFMRYYEAVRLNLPRALKALSIYIQEFDILDSILHSEQNNLNKIEGYFEIVKKYGNASYVLDVIELQFSNSIDRVVISSNAYNLLQKGDILNATLLPESNHWKIYDIQYIYPNLAKYFIFNHLNE